MEGYAVPPASLFGGPRNPNTFFSSASIDGAAFDEEICFTDKRRLIADSKDHHIMYDKARRIFARYLSVTDAEVKKIVKEHISPNNKTAFDQALKAVKNWKTTWQTKTARHLKEHVTMVFNKCRRIVDYGELEVQKVFDKAYEDQDNIIRTVFSQIAPVVVVADIMSDTGLLGEIYRNWYRVMCWLLLDDVRERFKKGDYSTTTALRRDTYDKFRTIARDKIYASVKIEDLPFVDITNPPRANPRPRKKAKRSNKDIIYANGNGNNVQAETITDETIIDADDGIKKGRGRPRGSKARKTVTPARKTAVKIEGMATTSTAETMPGMDATIPGMTTKIPGMAIKSDVATATEMATASNPALETGTAAEEAATGMAAKEMA